MSTLTVHCQWEDETVRERTGHAPSYAKAKKMKSMTLHAHGCLIPMASLKDFAILLLTGSLAVLIEERWNIRMSDLCCCWFDCFRLMTYVKCFEVVALNLESQENIDRWYEVFAAQFHLNSLWQNCICVHVWGYLSVGMSFPGGMVAYVNIIALADQREINNFQDYRLSACRTTF